jgi:hypothetical protein
VQRFGAPEVVALGEVDVLAAQEVDERGIRTVLDSEQSARLNGSVDRRVVG